MFGSPIVQAISAPLTGSGFFKDQSNPNTVLFLEVPNSGFGSGTPSFTLIAKVVGGLGNDWNIQGFNLCLSLPNPDGDSGAPVNAVIATYLQPGPFHLGDFTVTADVAVVNGVPSGTWIARSNPGLSIIATGTLSNFPTVPYPTQPANGANSVTTKIRRSLAVSLELLPPVTPEGFQPVGIFCTLQVAQDTGYTGEVITVNNI
jgi:hypothetical protein